MIIEGREYLMGEKKKHITGIITTTWTTANAQAAFTEFIRDVIWGKKKK